jgi:hypothetical protein
MYPKLSGKAVVGRSNAIQEALWQTAKAMAAVDKNLVPTGFLSKRSMK